MRNKITAALFAILFVVAYIWAIPSEDWNWKKPPVDNTDINIECPEMNSSEMIIRHTGYTLSYNKTTNCPNWVAWELTGDEASASSVSRSDDFKEDPQVPQQNRVRGTDYRKSGYDRGHMCPAADMKWSSDAMSDCFYMSNICPQTGELNQRWWEHLESACRRWAKKEGCVYICCGPIFDGKLQTIGSGVKVGVPSGFYKVVISLKKGEEKGIGFIYDNDCERQTMEDVCCSIDDVEKRVGINFFPTVDEDVQRRIEMKSNLREWD